MSNRARAVNDGDWICSEKDCANINFSWRVKCNKCGKEKAKVEIFKKIGSEIGKKAAERSGGLFSADDWQCSSCGNVNWARRMDCNVCNTPKFGTIEPRTGLGGGYNERENVEYIDREESDDEYDDFGRRKKKFRGKDTKEVKVTVNDTKITTTIFHDQEDDDSGEEIDLSKYDLAGDEEEEQEDGNVDLSKYDLGDDSPNQATHRRSRSRSRSRGRNRAKSPRGSGWNYSSRSSRSRSHSPTRKRSRSRSPTRDTKRRTNSRYSRSRSRSPGRKRKSRSSRSRSRSRDRDGRNSRSRSRSRDRYSRRSRSNSRDRPIRDRRTYRRSYSRSRSRSRERKRNYRSRSRSRERFR